MRIVGHILARDGSQCIFFFFFFKQKTAYEIGTGDWSSDVCSSDLACGFLRHNPAPNHTLLPPSHIRPL